MKIRDSFAVLREYRYKEGTAEHHVNKHKTRFTLMQSPVYVIIQSRNYTFLQPMFKMSVVCGDTARRRPIGANNSSLHGVIDDTTRWVVHRRSHVRRVHHLVQRTFKAIHTSRMIHREIHNITCLPVKLHNFMVRYFYGQKNKNGPVFACSLNTLHCSPIVILIRQNS